MNAIRCHGKIPKTPTPSDLHNNGSDTLYKPHSTWYRHIRVTNQFLHLSIVLILNASVCLSRRTVAWVVERTGLETLWIFLNCLFLLYCHIVVVWPTTNQQAAILRPAESRHRKADIQSLGRSYRDTLQVLRMPAPKFWYVGMYVTARRRFVKI